MAKRIRKKNQNALGGQRQQAAGDYYKLKTDAVDRLVNADKKTYTGVKKDPGKQYRSSALDNIPNPVKVLFVKFWFSGAVCFFIFWGLGMYVTDMLDMIVIMSVVLGMVTDILVNNALRFSEKYEGQNSKWMMFPKKRYWTFFANIIYSGVVFACVIWFYETVNLGLNGLMGTEDTIYIGVEPILFGISYMVFDLIFTGIKNTFISIVKDAMKKNEI